MALGDAVVVCSTTFEGLKKTVEETLPNTSLAGVKYSYRTASNTQHTFSSMVILYLPV